MEMVSAAADTPVPTLNVKLDTPELVKALSTAASLRLPLLLNEADTAISILLLVVGCRFAQGDYFCFSNRTRQGQSLFEELLPIVLAQYDKVQSRRR
jgi:hypothetical protein